MKNITNQYGMEVNNLTLTWDEFKELEPFLKKLGVRCRVCISDREGVTIQAENPYKIWANHPKCKEIADDMMTDFKINCYKR